MIEKVASFKERLNEALTVRNVRPVDLAKKTGISESTISQYRSGYAEPKEEKLALIANALRVNPTWLMGLNAPRDFTKAPDIAYTVNFGETLDDVIELRILDGYKKADELTKNMIERLLNIEKEADDGNGT